MQSIWMKGLRSKEDKDKRRAELAQYEEAFKALDEILEEKETTPDYDCPSWSHKQADWNGYNRAIRHVKKLITLTKD